MRTEMMVPIFSAEQIFMVPPCRFVSEREMASPRPEPPLLLAYWLWTCSNGWPIFSSAALGDADAGIGDRQCHCAGDLAGTQRDLAAVIRELHGIGQKVEQDLLHRAAVGHQRQAGANLLIDADVLLRRPGSW